ncbi:S24 family peptidase [Eubacterium sp. 1001713B170207_170306_E7]|uniref:LexA family protein n=1 Tax=Eubacterium sp. 1001713B170207_170306_E7 TaxID=2787097 RepID=UPI0018989799|nr:S24 family peptidase [Eubacterium sp. 1001713B170207_170306_E7]
MNWNDNVELFIPSDSASAIVNIDGSIEVPEPQASTAETMPKKIRNGREYILVTLRDHSMFDRYYKDDILNIGLQDTCENGQDALVLLENGNVRLRRVYYEEDTLILKPLNTEFYEVESCPKTSVQILGVVEGAVRIN